MALAAHVAETHLGESGLDEGEQQLGHALFTDLDTDTFLTGVLLAKQTIADLALDQGTSHLLLKIN